VAEEGSRKSHAALASNIPAPASNRFDLLEAALMDTTWRAIQIPPCMPCPSPKSTCIKAGYCKERYLDG